ncbi:oxidoreductase [Neisseria sp. N95_16]|uniref:NAD(P)-binding protein n=1 Tax=Neisseria brasiliensis TaxID=2666100 RepID=A0A5Q3S0Y4_9NEIS|nr:MULTISPECIES: hydroxysqualene dehydroxylase HpnE [Neisseria]MRN38906.1 NAD(P)-binding protein [Neisseria brasiliensis]PJO10543.1 oxidoreductase [Neisseria sp. N95_16]PJO77291.1 oxidoreductase [Neisseria sp. N177_16]QGL25787.1 NAD(P)-binding protein [Neisseria brasiliensis]
MFPNQQSKPKIAVIGAGWAGLSAAVKLVHRADVTLFEAGKLAGGRARSFGGDKGGFSFLDNGQHIMIGAYHGVLALMKQIGVREQDAFVRLPLQWYLHDGLRFQTAALPAPWHVLLGLLGGKQISWAHKFKLLGDMHALQGRHRRNLPDTPIAAWLNERDTPRKLIAQFWQPLVWGALNTPLEQASLNILCNVLSDGVRANKAGSDYLLPKTDLGNIMANPALAYLRNHGATIRLETRVPPLENLPSGQVQVNGEAFDAVILAVAPYHAAALMPSETPDYIQTAYQNIEYRAITTVYLRYAQAVNLPAPMTGFAEGTAQWLIARGALGLPPQEVAAVVSVSDHIDAVKADEWAAKVHADVKRVCPDVGEPVASRVITEKRATIASKVNRPLPDFAWLHHRGIYPCGDYLHPRYPATLEAAVQSGVAAADLCWHDWQTRIQP